MKKMIKIIAIFITLIIVNYNICFADLIVTPDEYILPIMGNVAALVGMIGIVIFIISIISFFALKATSKKNINANIEENEKINKTKKRIYVWGVILVIVIHLLSEIRYYDFGSFWFWLPIFICIISIAIRKKSKKFSNIILIISLCVICGISISNALDVKTSIEIDKYNDRFFSRYNADYSSIEMLINDVRENNETNKNQITIEYNNKEYKTSSELSNLLNILNKRITYKAENNAYSYNKDKFSENYITKIEIEEMND